MWFGAFEPQCSGHLPGQPERDSGFIVCVAADLEILHGLAVREILRFRCAFLQDWVARDGQVQIHQRVDILPDRFGQFTLSFLDVVKYPSSVGGSKGRCSIRGESGKAC
jgi:peroxiredoxin